MPYKIFIVGHMPQEVRQAHSIRKELKEVYANLFINTFAIALIGIFIPIYVLQLGFGVWTAVLFAFISFFSLGVFSLLSAPLAARIGLKHTILVSTVLYMAFFSLLILVEHVSHASILPLAFVWGACMSLFWVPMNSEFVRNSDKIHRGREVGELEGFSIFAKIVAPTVGGFLLLWLGFDSVFVIGIFLLLASAAPLFASRDYRRYFGYKLQDMRKWLGARFTTRLAAQGMLFAGEGVLWPLYVYTLFNEPVSVGAAFSIMSIGAFFFTMIIGRLSDRASRRKILGVGALLYSGVWFARLFVVTRMEVFLISFVAGLLFTSINVPMYASFCDFVGKKKIVSRVVWREFLLGTGRFFIFIPVLAAAASFPLAFILAGVAALVMALV